MMHGGTRQARTWDGMESDTAEIEARRRLFAAWQTLSQQWRDGCSRREANVWRQPRNEKCLARAVDVIRDERSKTNRRKCDWWRDRPELESRVKWSRAGQHTCLYGKPAFIFVLTWFFLILLYQCRDPTMSWMWKRKSVSAGTRTPTTQGLHKKVLGRDGFGSSLALKGRMWTKHSLLLMLSSKSGSLPC